MGTSNYYDDAKTQKVLEPLITQTLLIPMALPQAKPNIICVGTGKNVKYLIAFNDKSLLERIDIVPILVG